MPSQTLHGTFEARDRILLAGEIVMLRFLLFCILLVICWPVAIGAVILYPLIWLLLLPFRLVGLVVGGVFGVIGALFALPGRVLRAI